MNFDIWMGLTVLLAALACIVSMVAWSCRIIDNLNKRGEKTVRQILKEDKQ